MTNQWRIFDGNATNPVINTQTENLDELRTRMEQLIIRRDNTPQEIPERRRAGIGLILETLGFEIESVGLNKKLVEQILYGLPKGLGNSYSVTRDASTEMNNYYIRGSDSENFFSVSSHTDEARKILGGNTSTYVSGYEIVSSPMNIEIAEISLGLLLPALENKGDFITNRCASHVHVGMGANLDICKKALALGLYFDEVFFALSGMGEEFRGNDNNAIYARPLISGPYIKSNRNYYQILNWERALDADNFYDFWYAFHIDAENSENKYQSARYFATNIWSLLLHKTLEFRHLNQTFNTDYLLSFARLCQLFSEIVFKGDLKTLAKLEVGNVFEDQSPAYYISKLIKLIRLGENYSCKYELDNKTNEILMHLLEIHKPLTIKDVPVLTHLRDYNANMEMIEAGKLKRATTKPIPSGNIDIHNIKDVNILP